MRPNDQGVICLSHRVVQLAMRQVLSHRQIAFAFEESHQDPAPDAPESHPLIQTKFLFEESHQDPDPNAPETEWG